MKAEPIQWNLGLEKVNSFLYVRMPNDQGEIAPMNDGFLVKWPVNPHFTGISGIIQMLQELADAGRKPLAGFTIAAVDGRP